MILINTKAVDDVVSDKDSCVGECHPLDSSESVLECNVLEPSDSEQDEDESLQLENDVSHVLCEKIVPSYFIYSPHQYGLMSQTRKMSHKITEQSIMIFQGLSGYFSCFYSCGSTFSMYQMPE